ncbi:hypothetical protein [Brochothrix thermosphacta]|uniref:hypothetical protein n=1 Tax=Brochothrix thermosphacta TaxID=2756 RepID=UPI00265C94B6|nr:hypothetical protein [Brochothrix thermosphacta]WKK68867.1 hypothetical protein Q0G00_11385 [Brochothrix thermosphacta]
MVMFKLFINFLVSWVIVDFISARTMFIQNNIIEFIIFAVIFITIAALIDIFSEKPVFI